MNYLGANLLREAKRRASLGRVTAVRVALWLGSFFFVCEGVAQWSPPDYLRSVPVRDDCRKTKGAIGISFQPSLLNPHGIIFLCPERAAAIDKIHPGASFFFRVHEYGHLALGSRDEASADAWAAKELGQTPGGKSVLGAVILHFADIGEKFAPYYGTGFYRALNVATVGMIDPKQWPASLFAYQQRWKDRLQQNGSIIFNTERGLSADGLVLVDGNVLGFFDTLHPERSLPLPELTDGRHQISIVDVWTYRSGPNEKIQVMTRGLSAKASAAIVRMRPLVGKISVDDLGLSLEVQLFDHEGG